MEKDPSAPGKSSILGVRHIGIGVDNLEMSCDLYGGAFGYDCQADRLIMESEIINKVMPSPGPVQAILLARSKGSTSRLSSLDGGLIKLFHCDCKNRPGIFKGRRFGDPGLTEIAFDVNDIGAAYEQALNYGAKSLVPPTQFDWGFGPRGSLAYVSDHNGSVIELVELKSLFKMPPALLDLFVIRPTRWLSRIGIL